MARRRPLLLVALAAGLTLAGCATVRDLTGRLGGSLGLGGRQSFEGASYRARLVPLAAARSFQVTVTPAAAGPAGAREAGRFEAVQHCFFAYGSSDIAWTLSPDDPALPVAGDTLVLQGRCEGL